MGKSGKKKRGNKREKVPVVKEEEKKDKKGEEKMEKKVEEKVKEKEKEKEEEEEEEEEAQNGKIEKREIGDRAAMYNLGKAKGDGNFRVGVHKETLGRVAIKFIGEDAEAVSQSQHEMTIMKFFSSHPRLVRFFEKINFNEKPSLVMEYFSGGSLKKYLEAHSPITMERARFLFRQLLEAVHFLHSIQIYHRDIRLENIFLTETGSLKVSDMKFAQSKIISEKASGRVTPLSYSAPETLSEKNEFDGFPVDVWSCGVCLYYLVTNSLPFGDPDSEDLSEKILKGEYKPPDNLPGELLDLLAKILVVDPAERLTLSQIAEHDWCLRSSGQWSLSTPAFDQTPIAKDALQQEIVTELIEFGMKSDDIREHLSSDSPHFAKVYYRLLENFQEQKGLPKESQSSKIPPFGSSRRGIPRTQMMALDAGNRFKSTTDMLSGGGFRHLPSSSSSLGPEKRGRVVSICKPLSPDLDILTPGKKRRPVSIRERSTEIKDWVHKTADEMEVLSDGNFSPQIAGSGPSSFRRSLTSTLFQSRNDRTHQIALHERKRDETVAESNSLFERGVETEYLADESAASLFELDVQRDIIVSDADQAVVLTKSMGDLEFDDVINEDVDQGKSPAYESQSFTSVASPGRKSKSPFWKTEKTKKKSKHKKKKEREF